MNTNRTFFNPTRRLTWLLCAALIAIALPALAVKKKHNRGQGSYTHQYNSHYGGQSRGHSGGHSRNRNFDRYTPSYGYYDGYYDDYPVYSPGYRGHSSYGHSNYGRNRHNSLSLQFNLR